MKRRVRLRTEERGVNSNTVFGHKGFISKKVCQKRYKLWFVRHLWTSWSAGRSEIPSRHRIGMDLTCSPAVQHTKSHSTMDGGLLLFDASTVWATFSHLCVPLKLEVASRFGGSVLIIHAGPKPLSTPPSIISPSQAQSGSKYMYAESPFLCLCWYHGRPEAVSPWTNHCPFKSNPEQEDGVPLNIKSVPRPFTSATHKTAQIKLAASCRRVTGLYIVGVCAHRTCVMLWGSVQSVPNSPTLGFFCWWKDGKYPAESWYSGVVL